MPAEVTAEKTEAASEDAEQEKAAQPIEEKAEEKTVEKTEDAADIAQEEEGEDVPVQSISEMLAFAHKTEADDALNEIKRKRSEKHETEKEAAPEPVKAEEKEPEKPAEPEKAPEPEKPAETIQKEKPVPTGPVISEEEKARQAASLDALDRDLQAARKKKLQEEAYLKQKRETEIRKEAERLAKAQEVKQRHENAAAVAAENVQKQEAARRQRENTYDPSAAAAKRNAAALSGGAVSHGTNTIKEGRAVKQFNNTLDSMAAMKGVAVVILLVLGLYIAGFAHVKNINEVVYDSVNTKLMALTKTISDSSIEYSIGSGLTALSYVEKKNAGLSVGLIDSDKDGLTDEYERNISLTDPTNPDSDGDSVYDGAEIRAGLDPLNPVSDGTTPDGEVLRDTVIGDKKLSARLTAIPKTAFTSLGKLDNNSIQGTPGMVGYAYELYTDKPYEDCELVFTYEDSDLVNGKNVIDEKTLSVFKFNDEALAFEKVSSTFNPDTNTVTAHVTENGIYALCSSEILVRKGKTNIFFLIDNSGSMYPEELCANSEENDVDFKRLDFAVNLIDMLGVDALYGAGEFSGGYANIVPISSDYESVKKKINDIRDKKQVFSGTEIAGAISHAVNEFGNDSGFDRNYIILLTDGMPSVRDEAKDAAAIKAAQENNITIFTIGLGKYIDTDYLNNIAEETNGQFIQASNADALENIFEKIQNFMSYNQITIEEGSDQKGYIIADSGFNVLKDGIGYSNFRSDFAPNGADVGIAGFIRAYFRGELKTQAAEYTTDDGTAVPGYNISAIEGITDGKTDLKNVQLSALDDYNKYLAIDEKWDHRDISGGLLRYNDKTREFIDNAGFKMITAPFKFEMPDETGFEKFLRTITFSNVKAFTQYECIILDSSVWEGDDAAIMNMIKWYDGIPRTSDKCEIYDFGYEGDKAFDALFNELSTGSPAVITYGGSAMNAIRLTRDVYDPNLFILDAYDCNNPDRATKITVRKTPIYDSGKVTYQYSASRNSVEAPLRIVVMD